MIMMPALLIAAVKKPDLVDMKTLLVTVMITTLVPLTTVVLNLDALTLMFFAKKNLA